MRGPSAVLLLFVLCAMAFTSCKKTSYGGGSERPDAVTGATDAHPTKSFAKADGVEGGPCSSPIEGPAEVWPRIEAIREMDGAKREAECGIGMVEIFAPWRCPPMDLLEQAAGSARAEGVDPVEWARSNAEEKPEAAMCLAAADIISGWKAGDEPGGPSARAGGWSGRPGMEQLTREAAGLSSILEEVNEIHRLRCMLEVNVLGFAVECKPIHPQGKPISLNWLTATRDGLLDGLEIKSCKGKSCKRLRKTAAVLLDRYKKLLARVEDLQVEAFKEAIKEQMILEPFRAQGGI